MRRTDINMKNNHDFLSLVSTDATTETVVKKGATFRGSLVSEVNKEDLWSAERQRGRQKKLFLRWTPSLAQNNMPLAPGWLDFASLNKFLLRDYYIPLNSYLKFLQANFD